MKDQSRMSSPKTSTDSPAAISSRELPDGNSLFVSRAGLQLPMFGPDHAPVNRFSAPASGQEKPTSGISGPSGNVSSRSADLQLSLENRLRARMDVNGSPEYALTWSQWDMPWGLPICALRASRRRTSGKDCSGWSTPNTMDHLPSSNLETRKTRGGCSNLKDVVPTAGWATPNSADQTGTTGGGQNTSLRSQTRGTTQNGSPAQTVNIGVLNPEFVRWLQGFPTEWGNCVPTGIRSSRKSRRNS